MNPTDDKKDWRSRGKVPFYRRMPADRYRWENVGRNHCFAITTVNAWNQTKIINKNGFGEQSIHLLSEDYPTNCSITTKGKTMSMRERLMYSTLTQWSNIASPVHRTHWHYGIFSCNVTASTYVVFLPERFTLDLF